MTISSWVIWSHLMDNLPYNLKSLFRYFPLYAIQIHVETILPISLTCNYLYFLPTFSDSLVFKIPFKLHHFLKSPLSTLILRAQQTLINFFLGSFFNSVNWLVLNVLWYNCFLSYSWERLGVMKLFYDVILKLSVQNIFTALLISLWWRNFLKYYLIH